VTFVTRLKSRLVTGSELIDNDLTSTPPTSQPPVAQPVHRSNPATMTAKVSQVSEKEKEKEYVVPQFQKIPEMVRVLDPNQDGSNGLEINGGFVVRNGNLFLDLEFKNHTTEPVGPFMIKFNKNTFQITPAAPIGIQSVGPSQSESYPLQCLYSPPSEIQPTDLVQVALKTNLGVVYFTVSFPLFRLFVSEGRMEVDQYHKIWRSITTEQCADIPDINTDNMNLIRAKLEAYNIFFVASRSVSDEEFLYTTAQSIDGSVFLMELGFQGTTCKLCAKTKAESLVPLLAQSILIILNA